MIKVHIGQTFERLTVLEFSHIRHDHYYWLCQCVCGKQTIVEAHSLVRGNTKSCGCLKRELAKDNTHGSRHGLGRTSFYQVWASMIQRCQNKNNRAYEDYGGRGIRVCKRWLKFENFRDDMYESYVEHKKLHPRNTTIERKNNDGNYSKRNCCWATYNQQANNRREKRL